MTKEITSQKQNDRIDVEKAIVIVLAIGIFTGTLLTLLGLVLVFVHDPHLSAQSATYHDVILYGAKAPHHLNTLISQLIALKPIAFVTTGVGIIILTPVMRVGISIFSFLMDADYKFVVITAIVFILLVGSMIFAPSL
jgi:uncharacterized membrane protein